MTNLCKKVVIFEGPDGGGKTTLAKEIAEKIGAAYHHHGPYPGLDGDDLMDEYVTSMLPALRGERPVVLDRSWHSEAVYGAAFRGGADRLGVAGRRVLDRLAWRCGAVMVLCLPPVEACLSAFRRRKGLEMLDNEKQLVHAHALYEVNKSGALNGMIFDYTRTNNYIMSTYDRMMTALSSTVPHPVDVLSAGNIKTSTLLVGEAFSPAAAGRPYAWPFASINGSGCSRWLTEEIDQAGISERELIWVNADQDIKLLLNKAPYSRYKDFRIAALGKVAADRLRSIGVNYTEFEHPQSHKRFKYNDRYPLLDWL